MEWKEKTLSEICEIISGGTPKTSNQEYWNGEIPWISINDFNNSLKYIEKTEKTITNEGLKNSSTNLLKKDDIIISARGTVGALGMIRYSMAFNQSCYGIRAKHNINSSFLYYLLKYSLNKLKNNVHGSVFDTITKETFKNIMVAIPKLIKQEQIGKILSDIDYKILNLTKINRNLESILQTLYNEWFVNFGGITDFKSDDDFEKIPDNWEVKYLNEFVDFVTGVEPGSKNYHENPEPNLIPFYRVGDLGSRDNLVYINEEVSKNKFIKFDDIVLSLDATIGIVKIGLEGSYSTGMRKLVIKNNIINKPFLYCLVKSTYIQRIIKTYATGTTILHAGKSVNHMKFVLPPKDKLDEFNKIGTPIFNQILKNMDELTKLERLRDTLLPKLMNGEIDVSKIKIEE